jgi:hypothetical protein
VSGTASRVPAESEIEPTNEVGLRGYGELGDVGGSGLRPSQSSQRPRADVVGGAASLQKHGRRRGIVDGGFASRLRLTRGQPRERAHAECRARV